jgi:hypothetical protein
VWEAAAISRPREKNVLKKFRPGADPLFERKTHPPDEPASPGTSGWFGDTEMLKELFRFSTNENPRPEHEMDLDGPSDHIRALARLAEEFDRSNAIAAIPISEISVLSEDGMPTFEQIYQNAAVKPPRLAYSILKIADMMNSPHLSGLTPEAKRCSLLMALDAAGAEVEDLLQDAVVRQRALNDFEDAQLNRLKELEAVKATENRQIQADLDRLTNQYMALIQANIDVLAREQDLFRSWQKRKLQEAQRITDAATVCVPPGTGPANGGLTAVLERATTFRK